MAVSAEPVPYELWLWETERELGRLTDRERQLAVRAFFAGRYRNPTVEDLTGLAPIDPPKRHVYVRVEYEGEEVRAS